MCLERYEEALSVYEPLYREYTRLASNPSSSSPSSPSISPSPQLLAFASQPWGIELCYAASLLLAGHTERAFHVAKSAGTSSSATSFSSAGGGASSRIRVLILSLLRAQTTGPAMTRLLSMLSDPLASPYEELTRAHALYSQGKYREALTKYYAIYQRSVIAGGASSQQGQGTGGKDGNSTGSNTTPSSSGFDIAQNQNQSQNQSQSQTQAFGALYYIALCAYHLQQFTVAEEILAEYIRFCPMSPAVELLAACIEYKQTYPGLSERKADGVVLPRENRDRAKDAGCNPAEDIFTALSQDTFVSPSIRVAASLNNELLRPKQTTPQRYEVTGK